MLKNHDLHLPAWGPYTKKYTGISHIPNVTQGLRFDLSVVPGFYRRGVLVPNAKWESAHHAWEAAPDLSYYSYRYELEWKDQVYCDVSFSALEGSARLVRCECVNMTAKPQNLSLHMLASMNFPPVRPYSDEILRPVRVELPEGGLWVDGLDYTDLGFAISRPQDTLVYDAMLRGEIRAHGFVGGSAVGQGFGTDAGDWIRFNVRLPHPIPGAVIVMRYRTLEGTLPAFKASGLLEGEIRLTGREDFGQAVFELQDLEAGTHAFRMESLGEGSVELDGFAILPRAGLEALSFQPVEWQHVPEILPGPHAPSLLLKYPDVDEYYGLAWSWNESVTREIFNDELDRYFRLMVHEHVQKVLHGPGEGHFTDIFMRPIPLAPESRQVVYGLVCSGSQEEVNAILEPLRPAENFLRLESTYETTRSMATRIPASASGQKYVFSLDRMAATVLLNVVYPVYTRRSYIRHSTPGKWWDCLYTWDSGFIGLGLLETDLQRAVENLDAYLTEPGDPQAAFVHHGSLVPVQFYLFLEIWNRTQDAALLEYFYPRLRQYYLFLAGHSGSSTTRALRSNLLKTWDYFYNSGGWDDYPPQVHVRLEGLQASVAPVVTTTQAIRCAKILSAAARALGKPDDLPLYEEDITAFTTALQEHAWDPEAGYFSYVVHGDDGMPGGFLRHPDSGTNYNMGLDGASPLYAGICTPQQEALLLAHLFDPARMWTPIGISTVDRSAPYYRIDGYWNGAVWFPHQWFYWKAMLDLGQGERAFQIARTALDLWKQEVESSYYCFEHFIVQSGRGAGWHQFGGLSTPVLSWHAAYYRPGRMTVGLDGWIERQSFSADLTHMQADLHLGGSKPLALVTLLPWKRCQATWNGTPAEVIERVPGGFEVQLGKGSGRLNMYIED